MSPELQEKLFQKYPKIFVKRNPPQYPFDRNGIECWDGWYNILDDLCEKIQNHVYIKGIEQVEFTQIKQKFSLLRIYYISDDKIIEELIMEAEEKSSHICEKCGADEDVTTNKKGYLLTLCPDCRKEYKQNV